jgi:integrase
MQILFVARDTRLEALPHLAVKTSMRQGEILGLKWSDLDFIHRSIRVQSRFSESRDKA